MSNLNAFLNQHANRPQHTSFAVSPRFVDEEGQPVKWELRSLTQSESQKLKKECTKRVQVPGKKGIFTSETDIDDLLCKMAVACTVFPNLNDVTLQDSYQVMGAENLLQEMLLPGEYGNFMEKLQEINGFDISMEDKVEEAKN
ncbi:phage portal protein [Aminipila butyrica]|uniref:Phage portal protein n=1 Tax=Aminipila butyrica TaxID=433296 RepID=A0A858BUM2_9FIRM|nr:phage portal protein [Aminipila butyrica]QIB68640.1 phage portal protein [Aminipila butyrica]